MNRFVLAALAFSLLLGGVNRLSAQQIDLKAEGYTLKADKSTGVMVEGSGSSSLGPGLHYIPGSRVGGVFTVLNRGTKRAPDVTLRAKDLPTGWKFSAPDDFDADPGLRVSAGFSITVPADAAARKYSFLIEAYHAKEAHREDNFFGVVFNVIKDPYPMPDVDHGDRQKFAKQTRETELDQATKTTLSREIPGDQGLARIGKVYTWVDKNFRRDSRHGELVAKRSAQEIFKSGTLTGCNDHGILKTAILRSFGYPVVFMNTANVDWAEQFQTGKASGPHKGHTFLEVYVQNKWIVLDSVTGHYTEDYDFNNPVLRLNDPKNKEETFFVYHKGQDHWTIGVRSNEDNQVQMDRFARYYPLQTIKVPNKKFEDIKDLAKKAGYVPKLLPRKDAG